MTNKTDCNSVLSRMASLPMTTRDLEHFYPISYVVKTTYIRSDTLIGE